MNESKVIKEIYWLRALACLAVVVTHAVNTTLSNYEMNIHQSEEYFLIALRFIAFFGTPAFIFISELLLAYSYPNGVPKGFFMKRVKFLLLPFAFMALVFAIITTDTLYAFMEQLVLNLFLGGYTGYFVLIIFQFYLLHIFAKKFLDKWPPFKVIAVSLVISSSYLAIFHFTNPPSFTFGEYIWQRGHWLPIFGWLFYFTLGYYCGKHYQLLIEKILPYKKLIYFMPFISISIVFLLVRSDILTVVSSKRIDYLIYTTAMIAVILLVAYQIKKVPKFVLFISKYSFNIYLLHTAFLYFFPYIDFVHPLLYFVLAMTMSITASVMVVKLSSLWTFSPYLVGKTLPIPDLKFRENEVCRDNLRTPQTSTEEQH
ncbi:adhesin [Salipaludibacillus keqinensis]|uniref:Adhesin n=1 Tax=Salipaludibacillus keqinensis TaxID=2045207 RepID=A0A323TDP8_9BACI|nr:acyltransferase family protein [Salipaludibacillus keqinensis]PYZ91967.1 adhesin [Salipaludibacillus keqinensis]